MKLSTKGKYGVRALFEIARNFGKGPLAIKEIAERQKISLSYLEQILHKLGKAGIIESVRGPHGGYELARRPADLTIGDVVRALEGPIALSHCLEPGESGTCYQADDCVARMVWSKVGAKIEEALDGRLAPSRVDMPSRQWFPPTLWSYLRGGVTGGVW